MYNYMAHVSSPPASVARVHALDNGETCSPLDAFLRKFESINDEDTLSPREVFRHLFPFLSTSAAIEYNGCGEQILRLRESFFLRCESERREIRHKSLVSFIFASNRIEDCATDNEADTEAVVNGCVIFDAPMNGREEAEATHSVLRHTCGSDPSEVFASVLDMGSLLQGWHAMLTAHEESSRPGKLRDGGAFTYRDAGRKRKHHYPHHMYVRGALPKFCRVVGQLLLLCEKSEAEDAALHWFAVAAFAQFHFATLHPFTDGNGRMCRILSKFILDCWMPVSIPMFPQKEAYFQALIKGQSMLDDNRYADELFCVEPLFRLLVMTAIDHLNRVLYSRESIFIRVEEGEEASPEETTCQVLKALLTDRNIDAAAARGQIEGKLARLGPFQCGTFTLTLTANNAAASVTICRLPKHAPQVASLEAFEASSSDDAGGGSLGVPFDDEFF